MAERHVIPSITLQDGSMIPALGMGTAPMDDVQTEEAVTEALGIGYRLIDTAAAYGNEVGVGRGIVQSGVARHELRVLSKLRGSDQGSLRARAGLEGTLERLGLDHLDYFLIHWPLPRLGKAVETWEQLIAFREEGLVKSIGVSNFLPEHVDQLIRETGVTPAINQIEVHPQFTNAAWRGGNTERGIVTVAYHPLGRGATVFANQTLSRIGEAHGVSVAQVILRWHIQHGVVPIPRGENYRERSENAALFDFELSADEISRIDTEIPVQRYGFDPLTHEEF